MKHITRTAFWIFTLCFCFQAKSFPIDLRDSNINLMRSHVKCLFSDSTFYTPSNVEEQCTIAALDCFKTELNGTVKTECEDAKKFIDPAIEFLEHVTKTQHDADDKAQRMSSKCNCESWPQTPFNNFLNEMETLIQRIIDHHRSFGLIEVGSV